MKKQKQDDDRDGDRQMQQCIKEGTLDSPNSGSGSDSGDGGGKCVQLI